MSSQLEEPNRAQIVAYLEDVWESMRQDDITYGRLSASDEHEIIRVRRLADYPIFVVDYYLTVTIAGKPHRVTNYHIIEWYGGSELGLCEQHELEEE